MVINDLWGEVTKGVFLAISIVAKNKILGTRCTNAPK